MTVYLDHPKPIFGHIECIDEIKTEADDSVFDLFITCDVSARDRLALAGALFEKAKKTGNWKDVEKEGLTGFRRDTSWVLAKDTLLGANYDVANMRYVPGVPGDKIEFHMDTATLKSGSGYEIKVFVCDVPFKSYLRDLDPQLSFNLIDKAEKQGKYPGLRVGSLDEINNNAGNWE